MILATGMAVCLCLAVPKGVATVVLVNGLLLQLWGPLQFLGFFYRFARLAAVEMTRHVYICMFICSCVLRWWLKPMYFFFRELRQSIVDMEALLTLLRRKSAIPSGDLPLPALQESSYGLAIELR